MRQSVTLLKDEAAHRVRRQQFILARSMNSSQPSRINMPVEEPSSNALQMVKEALRSQAVFWLSNVGVAGTVRPCPLADRMKTLPVAAVVSTPEVVVPGLGANWDCPRGDARTSRMHAPSGPSSWECSQLKGPQAFTAGARLAS